MKKIDIALIVFLLVSAWFLVATLGLNTETFSVNIVDDVIHDKYEKNTDEYYGFRIMKDENTLAAHPENLILYDNLAVAYDHIGKLDRALELYKKKKELMEKREYDMQNWYRYYANLGTFLIHDGLNAYFKDKTNKQAQERVITGKTYIEKAIETNLEAHFGRENYQLEANRWLIASFADPSLMLSQNMLGKPSLDPALLTSDNSWKSCGQTYVDIYPETKKVGKSRAEQINDSCPMVLRWVIGMIRFGGGPNPFSFLTIGDILTSMGEYKLAFASYVRAVKMKHPNSDRIMKYSRSLAKRIFPELSEEDAYKKLLTQYEADSKIGSDWSNQYIKYQKKIIAAWKDPTFESSYDAFYAEFKHPDKVEYSRE